MDNPDLVKILQETSLAVPEVRQLVRNVDGQVTPLADSFRAVADKATGTLGKTDGTVSEARKAFVGAQGTLRRSDQVLDSANSLIEPGAQTHYELIETMQEIKAAARSIRGLANTLQRDPESVLFGKPTGGDR